VFIRVFQGTLFCSLPDHIRPDMPTLRRTRRANVGRVELGLIARPGKQAIFGRRARRRRASLWAGRRRMSST
jgi:hypothetical protein